MPNLRLFAAALALAAVVSHSVLAQEPASSAAGSMATEAAPAPPAVEKVAPDATPDNGASLTGGSTASQATVVPPAPSSEPQSAAETKPAAPEKQPTEAGAEPGIAAERAAQTTAEPPTKIEAESGAPEKTPAAVNPANTADQQTKPAPVGGEPPAPVDSATPARAADEPQNSDTAATPSGSPAAAGGEGAAEPAARDGEKQAMPAPDATPHAADAAPKAETNQPTAEQQPAQKTAAPATAQVATEPTVPTLIVETGGGAFAQAYQLAVLDPFAEKTGTKITPSENSDADGNDILLLDGAELDEKCRAGALAQLNSGALQPASTSTGPVQDDFISGSVKPCGVGVVAWSSLFVFNPTPFAKRLPVRLSDVFDIKRFPGKRALPANGRGLFEALLIADGVAAGEVYKTLETLAGVTQALKRLRALDNNVIWYDKVSDAIALVRDGKATIAMTSSGHAFVESARSGPLGLIWDGQVLNVEYLALSNTAKEPSRAKELMAFATQPEQLAALARQIPYGPMRRTGVALATTHAVTGQDLGPFLPTSQENLKTSVRFDAVWWKQNSERLGDALRTARRGPPLPSRP